MTDKKMTAEKLYANVDAYDLAIRLREMPSYDICRDVINAYVEAKTAPLQAENERLRKENKEAADGIQEFAHIFVEMMMRVDIDSPEWAQIKDAIKAGGEKAKAALSPQEEA